MASTVLAYANKAKDKVGEARGVSAAPPPPAPSAASKLVSSEKPALPKREPLQKPSGSTTDSKPSTSAAATSSNSGPKPSTSGTAPPPKPEPPAITRNRHDSQAS